MEQKLTIVVPCYNEQENIPEFFPLLLDFAEKNQFKVLAVNDGSSDETGKVLEKFSDHPCLEILQHKRNLGYGAAIKTGLKAVKTEFAITVDSDGQHRLEDILKCFEYIQETKADLVVGARENNTSGSYRTLGKWVIRKFAGSLLELPVKDLNSGMKCYRVEESRNYLELCPDTMAFSDVILLLMVNDGKLVSETPIKTVPRTAGQSTIGTRTAIVTIAEILNLAILLRPITTFFRLGLYFVIIGVIWGCFVYIRSRTITPIVSMFILLGMFSFMLGLLGEQLAQIRKKLANLKK